VIFVLDENSPASLERVCKARGHDVRWSRDITSTGASDEVVAAAVDELEGVLLTADRDFHGLVSRRPSGNVIRWRRIGRVLVSCGVRQMPLRLEAAFPLIEWEWNHVRTTADPRMLIELGGDVIRIER
jgi:predicted nuclease of predicted toxin-antitoxin system